jgi:hypothetical protein
MRKRVADTSVEETVSEQFEAPLDKKYLTQEEMLRLEVNLLKQKLCQSELDLLTKEEEKRQLEKKIYSAQSEALGLRIDLLNRPDPLILRRSEKSSAKMTSLKGENAELVVDLKKKYDITSKGLGYSPDTGEIVENDENEKKEE